MPPISISASIRSRSGAAIGLLEPVWLQAPKLTGADTERLAMGFLERRAEGARCADRGDVDFAYATDFGRFRASRGAPPPRHRHRLPHHQVTKLRTMDELGLPPGAEAPHAISQRPRPGDRLGRLGQIDHPRRAGRGGEPHAARSHHHAGGSRSSTSSSSKSCHVTQREVHSHTKSFAAALRGALREDPDVIMVGEMRDLETISLAITASETGHLVLGTLHTGNASRTLDRVLDVFPTDQREQIRIMVSESLRGIISQQLVPRADGKGRVAGAGDSHQYLRRRRAHPRRQDLHAPGRDADRQKARHEADGRLAAGALRRRHHLAGRSLQPRRAEAAHAAALPPPESLHGLHRSIFRSAGQRRRFRSAPGRRVSRRRFAATATSSPSARSRSPTRRWPT